MLALLDPLNTIGEAGYHLSRFCHYSGLSHPLVEMGMRTLPLAMVPMKIISLTRKTRSLFQKNTPNRKIALLEVANSGFTIAWALSAAFKIGDSLSPKLYSAACLTQISLSFSSNTHNKAKKIAEDRYDSLSATHKQIVSKDTFAKWVNYAGLAGSCDIRLTDLPVLEPFFFPRINSGIIFFASPCRLFF